jgi:hypothetical protein
MLLFYEAPGSSTINPLGGTPNFRTGLFVGRLTF